MFSHILDAFTLWLLSIFFFSLSLIFCSLRMICLLIFFYDIHHFLCFLNFLKLGFGIWHHIGKFSVTDANTTCVSFILPFLLFPFICYTFVVVTQFLDILHFFFFFSKSLVVFFFFPVYFSSLVVSMEICSSSDVLFSAAYSLLSPSKQFFIYVAVVLISRIYFGTFLGLPFFCFH